MFSADSYCPLVVRALLVIFSISSSLVQSRTILPPDSHFLFLIGFVKDNACRKKYQFYPFRTEMIKYICVVGFSCQLEITSRMQDAKYGLMSRPAIRLVPSKY